MMRANGDTFTLLTMLHCFLKIPAGMSAYQADWYVDEDGKGNFDEEDDEDEEGGERMKVPDDASVIADIENDDDDNASMMGGSVANTVTFGAQMSTLQSADAALTEKRRLRTLAQAKDDKEFPDELDTPADVTARLRFARYRALQSFRSSPWHPKENLPTDYSRIFQFENFSSAQRRYHCTILPNISHLCPSLLCCCVMSCNMSFSERLR